MVMRIASIALALTTFCALPAAVTPSRADDACQDDKKFKVRLRLPSEVNRQSGMTDINPPKQETGGKPASEQPKSDTGPTPPDPKLEMWKSLRAQGEALEASPDPEMRRLGRTLKIHAEKLWDPVTPNPTPSPPVGVRGELKSDASGGAPAGGGSAAVVEDWANAALFLWLSLGVDPLREREWSGVSPIPPPVTVDRGLGTAPQADSVLRSTEEAKGQPAGEDPKYKTWEAIWKTAKEWEGSSDRNLRQLAPWMKRQAELLYDGGGANTTPPTVSSVDPKTGTFEFRIGLGTTAPGDDDEDGPLPRVRVFLSPRLHVEVGGQHDSWPLFPVIPVEPQKPEIPPTQIQIETKLLELPGAGRSLDSWISKQAWEDMTRKLPAVRSEGFDTSAVIPFSRANVNLVSTTLASPACHQLFCTQPGCTHSEPDAQRKVAPAPGLHASDWPAGSPPTLSIDLDELDR